MLFLWVSNQRYLRILYNFLKVSYSLILCLWNWNIISLIYFIDPELYHLWLRPSGRGHHKLRLGSKKKV